MTELKIHLALVKKGDTIELVFARFEDGCKTKLKTEPDGDNGDFRIPFVERLRLLIERLNSGCLSVLPSFNLVNYVFLFLCYR